MTVKTTQAAVERRRVRVWFGDHAIADHIAAEPNAARYAAAMERRFSCCRVTNEPLPAK